MYSTNFFFYTFGNVILRKGWTPNFSFPLTKTPSYKTQNQLVSNQENRVLTDFSWDFSLELLDYEQYFLVVKIIPACRTFAYQSRMDAGWGFAKVPASIQPASMRDWFATSNFQMTGIYVNIVYSIMCCMTSLHSKNRTT